MGMSGDFEQAISMYVMLMLLLLLLLLLAVAAFI